MVPLLPFNPTQRNRTVMLRRSKPIEAIVAVALRTTATRYLTLSASSIVLRLAARGLNSGRNTKQFGYYTARIIDEEH